jgi:hypothetical protein
VTKLCPKEMTLAIKFEKLSNPYLFDVRNNTNETFLPAIKITENRIHSTFGNPPIYLREEGSIDLISM